MLFSPIHTPRLILRQWQESDHEPYIAMNLDLEVMRYFPALQTREATQTQIERIRTFIDENGYGLLAVERIDTGEFIGFTGLSQPRFESFFTPCVEIGWRLDKAHWGNGFAQEAAKAMLAFGFDQLGLNEIYSFTSGLNLPSINVMKKIGMKEVGQFEHPNVPDGDRLRMHVLYKIDQEPVF
jgi:RimJ/RimL family protein N-acetyltransferase